MPGEYSETHPRRRGFLQVPGCKCCRPTFRPALAARRLDGAVRVAHGATSPFPAAEAATANPHGGASRLCWSMAHPPADGRNWEWPTRDVALVTGMRRKVPPT